MTVTTFQILWNEIGPLVSQVLRSHSAKSHVFPSSIIHINPFLQVKNHLKRAEKKICLRIKGILFEFLLLFLITILQNVQYNRVIEA